MTETNKRIRVQIDLTPSRYQKLKELADSEARTISSYCIYHLLLKPTASTYVNQTQPQGETK